MKRRQWKPDEKLKIVMEGLRADCTVSELCNRHQITQTQYYQWRDKLLSDGSKVFAHGGVDKTEERLQNEVNKLKTIIGDLTVELKKRILIRQRTLSPANHDLLVKIKNLKDEHPSWGYRRVWFHLKFRQNINVNKKHSIES